MTIAKGRTNCEAERDTIVLGFNDLLRVLQYSKMQTEEHAKAALFDIIHDKTLSEEERLDQMKPYCDLLSEQEEKDIRIRRTILIGLFAFWELSLKNICEYYRINVGAAKGQKPPKEGTSNNGRSNYKVNDYISALFRLGRPDIVELISSKIKELRNYMTHGSADEKRQAVIDSLMAAHPEFYISKNGNDYYINSYNGFESILKNISDGLQLVEKVAKDMQNQIKTQSI